MNFDELEPYTTALERQFFRGKQPGAPHLNGRAP